MVSVLKLAMLIFCIQHVMNNGRPARTAIIYSGLFLVVGLVFSALQQFTVIVAATLAITFVYDLLTGFVFFWLIDRFGDNTLAFYLIIIFGIAASLAIKALLVVLL